MKKKAFAVFFWIFNVTLLLIVYLGYLPYLAPTIIADAIAGQVPFSFLLPFVGLVGVPTTCTAMGAVPKQRRSLSLFQIFYGIEAPFLLLCVFRFFLLRDLTPVTTLILLTGLAGTIAFTHWFFTASHPESEWTNWWHLAGLTLLLGIALYLLTLAAFYILPIAVFSLLYFPILVVYLSILFPLTALLIGFASMPWGMARVYYRAWRQSFDRLSSRYGKSKPAALTAIVVVAWAGLFALVQPQPQIKAFQLLQTPPQTEKARTELLQKSNLIREGLLTAYLASYRYPRFKDETIYYMYRDTSESAARSLQQMYDFLTSPFTYKGEDTDGQKASALYAQFFDTPIVRGERAAIQKALQSTYIRDEAKAGLLDINEQRVLLSQQQVNVKPQGDWADVEIYEVYQNQTYDLEEILYYFSLPETAVVTGVWLGETGDRAKSYPFTVSPRGAAQQVYNREVARSVDPALLEQVGPRNYRLRAFPIPPNGQGEMHLWLTYKVLKQDGGWPLPQLHERRNVYWTNATQRTIDGKRVASKDQWLPDTLPATNGQPTAHQVTLPGGQSIQAKPFDRTGYRLHKNKRFAVIVDGSYSMNAHRQEVVQAFQWLQTQVLKQNTADLYLTVAQGEPKRLDGLQDFSPDRAVFYGTLQHRQMLQQFQQLRGNTAYNAVILLTDAGSYELTEDKKAVLSMPAPLWMVHLGGFPKAYDDATLQALQDSGGGVSDDIETVMQRIGTRSTLGNSLVGLADGYAWFVSKTTEAPKTASGFTPIAARQWVTQLSRQMKPKQVEQLDAIHAVAKQYGIVTPYSSMIVLVNDSQRQDLKQAEQQSDRFNRQVEDQQLPRPSGFNAPVSGAPEPTEWLLLFVGAIALGLVYQFRRRVQPN